MLTEFKDVYNLKILTEEVRLDQDIQKNSSVVCAILCELEYMMPYYLGGCNISGLT